MSDKIDQSVVDGSGNAFSGSGPVTVNNITKNYYPPEKPSSTTNSPSELAPLFGVPNLPPRYLERDEYLDPFREALLSGEIEAVGITGRPQYVGVQGMGGLGKSVLAAALAWDEEVRRAFPDGIFWLRFGQEVDEAGVMELQKEILLVLAPDNLPESPAQGRNLLSLALQGKRCLLIADDLWDSRHINHFDLADSGSRFLLTTRNNEVIQETGAHRCELELLSPKQARELLAKCSGFAEEDLPEEAEAILRECGRLPLAVAAIGSMVNGKGRSYWQLALKKLQTARLDKIPTKFDRYSGYENLFKVFQVSVEDLPPEVQDYFKTLIVFPEDIEIPESVLQLYWEHIGQGEYEPLEAIDLLVQRALLTPAGEESFTLHDLLRDYLVFQADGEVAELHRQLLEAYRAVYPNGWHTIPWNEHAFFYNPPYYFQNYWDIHARATKDADYSNEIANNLIQYQQLLNPKGLRTALEITGNHFSDVASVLLKESQHVDVLLHCLDTLGGQAKEGAHNLLKAKQHPFVIVACLKLLKNEGKEEAHRLLKANHHPTVIATCFGILGVEAKEDAQRFLKESEHPHVLAACLNILGDEAREDARRLLKKSQHPLVLATCFGILGVEAKEDAQRFLKESEHPHVLTACLNILGDEAKEDARRLLKESDDKSVLVTCLNLLGKEAKQDARRFLQKGQHPDILTICLKTLGAVAKEDAKRLLKESDDKSVLVTCLNLLGNEANDDARRFLQKGQHPDVLTVCLNILGDEAKEDAHRLLKESSDQDLLIVCLRILGDEAKDDAKRLLKESKNEHVLVSCLYILGDEAKKEARQLLKTAKYEGLLVTCISILGKEAKADAIRLSKKGENRLTRENCRNLLLEWDNSIGGRFPELARLKKNLAGK